MAFWQRNAGCAEEYKKVVEKGRPMKTWAGIWVGIFILSLSVEAAENREFLVGKKYLNLPVKKGAALRRITMTVEGKVVREFEIELADTEPDFWVFLDLTPFTGKKATLAVRDLPVQSHGFDLISQDDWIRDTEDLYREKCRPQFHFTSRRGWNNDSNGLVFYGGEYHLYYQHNPYGVQWGNMHWGHAVSTDLVHWQELPIALYPRQFGDWCFSGSAVVDVNNTGGFKTGPEDVIVAAYTSTGRGECIAYSNDRGRTFVDYAGNPVVKHQGRDPKVIWYGPGRHWVMAVYHEIDGKQTIAFHTSNDLRHWRYESRIEGFYECPEIFELAVDANALHRKWVLYAGDGSYRIGAFDGHAFTPESDKIQFSFGNCFYASQTYNNLPAADGRRIQIAWGRVDMPGMPFNQMMLFPVELTLRTTSDGVRLCALPVREIQRLYQQDWDWKDTTMPSGRTVLSGVQGKLFHVKASFRTDGVTRFGLLARGTEVVYDTSQQQLSCQKKTAALPPRNGTVQVELLVDRTSIEIFGNDGQIYMPIGVLPKDSGPSLEVLAEGGPVRIDSLEVHRLGSIW